MRRTQCRPKVPCLTPPFHPSSRSIRTEPAMHKAVLLEKPARNCKLCGDTMNFVGEAREPKSSVELRVFRCHECCLVATGRYDKLHDLWTFD
jgi:hypothetical protein